MTEPSGVKLLLWASVLTPLLGGCENKVPVVTPEIDRQMAATLLDGRAVLDCQFQCVASWSARRQEFSQENAAHDWHGLATGVMQVGYQSDLGYFYLGRAAQGQGADEAAIRYYEISAAISQGPNAALKCKGVFDNCDGIAMPYILVTLIQQAQTDLVRRRAAEALAAGTDMPATPTRHHQRKAAPKPAIQQPSDIPLVEPPPVTR